jgi:hypothetical protein
MAEVGGAESSTSGPGSAGSCSSHDPGGVGEAGEASLSGSEQGEVSAAADAVSDEAACTEADALAADADAFEAAPSEPTEEAAPAEVAPAAEEPSLLESAASWAGDTLKGYATGIANQVLDTASLLNTGINAVTDVTGIDAAMESVGLDATFPTGIRFEPTSAAEANAQNAIDVAALALGVQGAVKSAPAIARGLDDLTAGVGSFFRSSDEVIDVARATEVVPDARVAFSLADDANVTDDVFAQITPDTPVYRAGGFNPDGSIAGATQVDGLPGRYVYVGGDPSNVFTYGTPQVARMGDLAPYVDGLRISGFTGVAEGKTVAADGLIGILNFDQIPAGVFRPAW